MPTITVNDQLVARLRAIANNRGEPLDSLVERLLEHALNDARDNRDRPGDQECSERADLDLPVH